MTQFTREMAEKIDLAKATDAVKALDHTLKQFSYQPPENWAALLGNIADSINAVAEAMQLEPEMRVAIADIQKGVDTFCKYKGEIRLGFRLNGDIDYQRQYANVPGVESIQGPPEMFLRDMAEVMSLEDLDHPEYTPDAP